MRVALLITTYNSPEFLSLVLESVKFQTVIPDEVIVCDDGSGTRTAEIVTSWSDQLPIRHVWASDIGFRAALIRNLGILKSTCDVLVFVDGDCLLPPSFMANHLKLVQPGYLVSGGRHLLSAEMTELLLEENIGLTSVFNCWKFLTLPLGFIRKLASKNWKVVRSCNISICREDVCRVAGFDEAYVGWGREDSDFVVRLIRAGIKIRLGRLATCIAHLNHPESSRDQLSANDQRFRMALGSPAQTMATRSKLYQ